MNNGENVTSVMRVALGGLVGMDTEETIDLGWYNITTTTLIDMLKKVCI
jgi:hypothetical protein